MAYGRSDFDPTCQPYNTGFYDYYGRRGPNYTNEAVRKLFQRAADTAGCYQYGTDMTPIHYRQPGLGLWINQTPGIGYGGGFRNDSYSTDHTPSLDHALDRRYGSGAGLFHYEHQNGYPSKSKFAGMLRHPGYD
ncbi:hypothetical protein B0A54_16782 [Friedmanniomyces endolithicus]|uniref:Uncharacterized protein n=1 Tax=Friedmanniomyces endolithicus TaxID=329885 RepID=A0A4V5N4G8_9PEZI|nr:hypothetical protein LTS09_003999 [Friedmanniomyces endolithicus]TKA27699.1 hypothetical protein B0A54_16782 [Friedmanniomyces endolithicus]